jgi:YYY domain-containing protein
LHIQTDQGQVQQPLSYPADLVISPEQPYIAAFSPRASGELDRVSVFHARDSNGVGGMGTIQVLIADNPERNPPLGQGSVSVALEASQEGQGQAYSLVLDPPVEVAQDSTYYLQIDFIPQGAAAASFSGAALANETSWDDGLPLRVDGLDPYGGIYQGGLNLEMYWPDSEEKAERFVTTLDQADYLLITSSRQWGSIGRLPDRYPLSTTYYRSLLGCPVERSLEWCYNVAQPGMFQGELGYELERVFASNPNLGNLQINDQPAEEAFTVYDHPKVFIFRKTATLETQELAELFQGALAAAGTSDQQAGRVRQVQKTLLLPPQRLEAQREGGTWSALFNAQGLVNRSPYLSVLAWYLSLGGVGLVAYPIVRAAFPGLRDHGYPASRMVGLLLLAYFPWLAGSVEIPFSRLTIAICGLGLALVSALFAYRQRESLRSEWRHERRYLLVVEGLFLAFFLVGLLIRLGNPDLWHPWKGGEKPMDFSYFNAVLKSSTFPPYDPWYAGGYINYYYYGFVLVGVLVKALGIEPAVAYNLILPTLFALIGMGAFSFGWNLIAPRRLGGDRSEPAENGVGRATGEGQAYIVGLSGSLGMVVLGNLGTLRMIFRGYQSLAAPGADLDALGFLSRMFYAAQGFFKALAGTPLPYALADWYWNPSRAIQPDTGNPITEFPFFTFLYADLHAHLIALPLTLLVLLWGLSVVRSRARWSGWIAGGLGLFLGGLAIGALRPTNTWDFYPYLLLGVLALAYGYLRRALDPGPEGERDKPLRLRLVVPALVAVLLLVGLAHLLYQPFSEWYVQGYTQVDFWPGGRTPTGDYLTHWGVFLFVIVGWMAWETRQWMASTPLSALAKLAPYRGLIYAALAMLLVWTAVLLWQGVHIAWLVLPVAVWAGILLFRPGMPSRRRVVLFMTGTALALTLMVEVIVLQGDIGRMNTVFKFYLQAWTLFALSAAGALGWLVSDLPAWSPEWRRPWQVALSLLVAAAALYPLLGGLAKVKDRMAVEAPHTLDGMEYMAYATYQDLGTALDLSEDYRAIRWLQENVQGSPVIVEANSLNLYHWFSRMTINTGLPGVVGWDWHQRQQRAFVETSDVTGRVYEVEQFYNTEDLDWARAFLERFEVEYIVVGQLEKASYAGPGLEKFPAFDGIYWRQEYQNGETAIYRVIGELALGAQP